MDGLGPETVCLGNQASSLLRVMITPAPQTRAAHNESSCEANGERTLWHAFCFILDVSVPACVSSAVRQSGDRQKCELFRTRRSGEYKLQVTTYRGKVKCANLDSYPVTLCRLGGLRR